MKALKQTPRESEGDIQVWRALRKDQAVRDRTRQETDAKCDGIRQRGQTWHDSDKEERRSTDSQSARRHREVGVNERRKYRKTIDSAIRLYKGKSRTLKRSWVNQCPLSSRVCVCICKYEIYYKNVWKLHRALCLTLIRTLRTQVKKNFLQLPKLERPILITAGHQALPRKLQAKESLEHSSSGVLRPLFPLSSPDGLAYASELIHLPYP